MTEDHRQKILIVDDTPENIQVLMEILKADYRLVAAINGKKALKLAAVNPPPDLILLDVMMPEMDGHEVCRRLKSDPHTAEIPVIFVTALADEQDEERGLDLGAVDYITKPIKPALLRARVRNHLKLKEYQDNLEAQVRARTRELALVQAVTIESLGTLAEYRDPETGGHIKRTQNYVKALANRLQQHPDYADQLDQETVELLYLSAPLHDVGKVGVPDRILKKPGPLTNEEFEEMKKHTIYGRDALRITERKLGRNHFLRCAREIAYSHHEKWDGSGYPQGLAGEKIPLSGRLMALADVYDALISKRVYKPPFSHEKAVEVISEGAGCHFDPEVAAAFSAIENTFRNIALTYADYDEERDMLASGQSRIAEACRPLNKILLVEDNEINLEIMQSQLLSEGYEVETAVHGKEALDKYAAAKFDIILTDLEMPEMDGYQLTHRIRQMETHRQRIPILAITANDFDLNETKAKSLGFDSYMLKPFEVAALELKLHQITCNGRE
jgi:putative two-component system response regulator